jgi:predicted DNA-binding antitoxin AbrB/MazE fold protein
MTLTIEAVYANGAFQPKQPVTLAEGTPGPVDRAHGR